MKETKETNSIINCDDPMDLRDETSNDIRERYGAMKRLTPAVQRSVSLLTDENNVPAKSKADELKFVAGCFTKTYGSTHTSFTDAVGRDR